jgi:pimeloyl-ACP methyl ester carboxylesterase
MDVRLPPGTVGTVRSRDGVIVAYEVWGSGDPAVVLVHGWACDRRFWARQVDHLARRWRVVGVDLGGHGESGVGRSPWTMPAYGEDVVAVADELGLEPMVLVGHSMGGDVVAEAAVRMPGRVLGLVWLDAYDSLADPPGPEQVEEFVSPLLDDYPAAAQAMARRACGPTADEAMTDWIADVQAGARPEVAVDALAHALAHTGPVAAALDRIRLPVVAINSDRPTDTDSLAAHGVSVTVVEGVGHFLMMERPDLVNPMLEEAIAAVAAG